MDIYELRERLKRLGKSNDKTDTTFGNSAFTTHIGATRKRCTAGTFPRSTPKKPFTKLISEMTYAEIDASLLKDSDQTDNPFYSKYEPKEILGSGLCSVVRRCVEKVTQVSYAVKIIDLTRQDNAEATEAREAGYNEIRMLRLCSDHTYVIQLHDAFETPAFLFLIFEICPNGELFDLLTKKVRLSEKRVRTILKQLLEALSYLHSLGIMHRDIKCENILLNDNMDVRLSDFGFATTYDKNINYRELLGTPGYLSPEMLKANTYADAPSYDVSIDMWACGVVLYTLISGTPPFYNRKMVYMLRDIMNGKYSFPGAQWDDVSGECKDLIQRMLCVDPSERITAKEALQHTFFFSRDSVSEKRTLLRKLKSVYHIIRFITRLKTLSKAPQPLSKSLLSEQPYRHKPLRKLLDEAAFSIYGHWVQRTDDQNRGALFQNYPRSHPERTVRRRYRLLSGSHSDEVT